MAVVRWNPFREFDELWNRYNMAQESLGGRESLATQDWRPAVDIRETDKAYEIDVEIPAIDISQVDVSVKDRVLTVSGERRDERSEGEGVKAHRVERFYGRFSRSFALPEDADEEAVSARAENGVLYLTVPKREKPQSRTIEVKVA